MRVRVNDVLRGPETAYGRLLSGTNESRGW